PIIGRFTAFVDSSRSEILAGLSKWPIVSVPPGFWAEVGGDAANASKNEPAAANPHRLRFIPRYLLFITRAGKPATPSLPARLPGFHARWSASEIITYRIGGTGAVPTLDQRCLANCRARRLPCANR